MKNFNSFDWFKLSFLSAVLIYALASIKREQNLKERLKELRAKDVAIIIGLTTLFWSTYFIIN